MPDARPMLRLGASRAPRWVDMPHGVRLLMTTATEVQVTAAQLGAAREMAALDAVAKTAADAGLPAPDGAPQTPEQRTAVETSLVVVRLAQDLVRDWSGVHDDRTGEPVPFDASLLPSLLSIFPVGGRFWAIATALPAAVSAEGNG